MPHSFNETLLKAARMTRNGHLMDATRLIQQALAGVAASTPPSTCASPASARAANDGAQPVNAQVIDVQAREIMDPPTPAAHQPANELAIEPPNESVDESDNPPVDQSAVPNTTPPAPSADAKNAASAPFRPGGRFVAGEFAFDGNTYPYRLYVPALPAGAGTQQVAALPLVVLLHGCTQNAADFAAGTAMNPLADTHGCLVLYPQQIASSNAQMCWNWFEPAHQAAGRGETGMIAALTQHILDQPAGHYASGAAADPSRVYIAGLSAGGAMAAVVAAQHPALFAAVGVHSGLAAGAARNMMSALKAMGRGAAGTAAAALPTIVFHGTADKTVSPANGDSVTKAAVKAIEARQPARLALVASHDHPAANAGATKKARRTVYRDTQGTPLVELWSVAAGPHAWSGGDPAGSYTDPGGPSASAAMLAFFLQHRKA